jgi:hypothetical protein
MNNPYRTPSDEQRPRGGYVCTCCQRRWDICVGDGGGFATGRQRTCRECHAHGPVAMARDRAHIQVWRELASTQRRSHRAEATLLKDRIAELEQELRARPEEIIERYVDRDELDGARAEAERAFRSRENAWQALCEVRLVHREGEPGRCRCGQRLDRCKVAMIVDRYPGLEKGRTSRFAGHEATTITGSPMATRPLSTRTGGPSTAAAIG